MIEALLLAIALSMDAFAVALGLGASRARPAPSAVKIGLFFGGFQAFMPLVGYLGGRSFLGWAHGYSHWIAFALLVGIGLKMVRDSFSDSPEIDVATLNNRTLLTLAVATSIDAMAAGFSLSLLSANPYAVCLVIGVTTLLFSMLGVAIGKRSGTWLENKAELFGGVVLIALGLKFVLVR